MTIDEYIDWYYKKYPHAHPDKEFGQMLEGRSDTTEAVRLWKEIATGKAHVLDAIEWVKYVAQQIEREVVNCKERDAAPAALKAIGMYGRTDPHRRARECLVMISDFDFCDDSGNPLPRTRASAMSWVIYLRKQGHLNKVLDKTAENLVNQWRKELHIDI